MTLADQIEQMKTALTVDEFAGMMNVSKKFVYKMLKRKNGLESYQLFGIIRLDPVSTAQWLRSRTLSKRADTPFRKPGSVVKSPFRTILTKILSCHLNFVCPSLLETV